MNLFALAGLLLANVALNVGGTSLLKFATTTENVAAAALGCGLYALAAAVFLILLQHQSLATLAVITQLLGMMASVAIGILVFGETLTFGQWIGVGVAIVAVALTSLPAFTN